MQAKLQGLDPLDGIALESWGTGLDRAGLGWDTASQNAASQNAECQNAACQSAATPVNPLLATQVFGK